MTPDQLRQAIREHQCSAHPLATKVYEYVDAAIDEFYSDVPAPSPIVGFQRFGQEGPHGFYQRVSPLLFDDYVALNVDIVLNDYERLMMTIAHELGHWCHRYVGPPLVSEHDEWFRDMLWERTGVMVNERGYHVNESERWHEHCEQNASRWR